MTPTDPKKELQNLIFKMITDHILFSCSPETLKRWREQIKSSPLITQEEIKNMNLRKRIVENIRNFNSNISFNLLIEANAFDLNKEEDKKLFFSFAKLTFIDFINNNQIEEALEFVREHLSGEKGVERLYTLLGYGEITQEVLDKLSLDINRGVIVNELNSFLFHKLTGRRNSLVHSTVDYYKTLVNVQK